MMILGIYIYIFHAHFTAHVIHDFVFDFFCNCSDFMCEHVTLTSKSLVSTVYIPYDEVFNISSNEMYFDLPIDHIWDPKLQSVFIEKTFVWD